MSWKNVRWVGAVVVMSGMAVGAWAQSPVQEPGPPGGFPGGGKPGIFIGRPGQGPGPMGGVFSFVEPVGENAKLVKDAPFSAQVVRSSTQKLADGNMIERKSTGTIARDVAGRTRREMTLENIGPLAAAGKAPHLVFINDPVAGKVYTLDENRKTAMEMAPPPKFEWTEKEGQRPQREQRAAEFKSEMNTESLGQKTMEGVLVEGTRITRTIPAGQIGNAKPIVITTERWYSPDLQTTVLLTRSDPRFGTTTYQLTNINQANPPQSLFAVPSDYTIKQGRRMRMRMRPGRRENPGPPPMLP
jgi:hypothetical protein